MTPCCRDWRRAERPTGERRPLTEADFARSYVTHSELFGSNPTWEMFFGRLQAIGLQSIMASLSFINSVLYIKGGIQAQREIVSKTFDRDLMARLSRLPDLESRVVYSPAQTLLVMRSARLHSPNREHSRPNAQYGRAITVVLLIANDLLDADLRTRVEAATAGTDDPDVGVYWLLFDSMSDADRRRWSAFYGHIVEAYVRDTIQRALPAGPDLAQRVFPEFIYRIGRREYRTTDVVGLYPGAVPRQPI